MNSQINTQSTPIRSGFMSSRMRSQISSNDSSSYCPKKLKKVNFDLDSVLMKSKVNANDMENEFNHPKIETQEYKMNELKILEQSNDFSKKFKIDNSNIKIVSCDFVGINNAFNILIQIDQFLLR